MFFELLLDAFLILFIVCFWYFKFRVPIAKFGDSPCLVENQQISDPYGALFTCDKDLIPVRNQYQPALESYDGKKVYYNLEKHVLSSYDEARPDEIVYRRDGLEPLYFKKPSVSSFQVRDGRIVFLNTCTDRKDGSKVQLTVDEVGFIDNTLGTPYGVCKGGSVDKILYCPKYYDFDTYEGCVPYNPCAYRVDGYVIRLGENSFDYCLDSEIHTVSCDPNTETLIDYKCVPTPCKNIADGQIVKLVDGFVGYYYCEGGQLLLHNCLGNQTATFHGCVDNVCHEREDGLNSLVSDGLHQTYAARCEKGIFKEFVRNEDGSDLLVTSLCFWNGGSILYETLGLKGGVFARNKWVSALYDVLYYNVPELYVTFRTKSVYDERVFCWRYVRVRYTMTYDEGIVTTVLDKLYLPSSKEDFPSRQSKIEEERVVLERLAKSGILLVIFDKTTYCDLTQKPYARTKCPEGEVTNFVPQHPCIPVHEVFEKRVNIPYQNFEALLWDPDVSDINQTAEYVVLPSEHFSYSGSATKWENFAIAKGPSLNFSDSPFCGTNKSVVSEEYTDKWEDLVQYIVQNFSQERFEECYSIGKTIEDVNGDSNSEVVRVEFLSNESFFYMQTFKNAWLAAVNDKRRLFVYVENPRMIGEDSILGELNDESKTLSILEKNSNQDRFLSIDVDDLLSEVKCVRNSDSDFTVIVADTDNDQDILYFSFHGFQRKSCALTGFKRHEIIPACVHPKCTSVRHPIFYDKSKDKIFNCNENAYNEVDFNNIIISYNRSERHITSLNDVVADDYVYGEGSGTGYVINYWQIPLPSKITKLRTQEGGTNFEIVPLSEKLTVSYVCKTGNKMVCGSSTTDNTAPLCFDDTSWDETLDFILENVSQEDFAFLFSFQKEADTIDYEVEYFEGYERTQTFRELWLRKLTSGDDIVILSGYRKVSVPIDDRGTAWITMYSLGDIRNDSKILYFADIDSDQGNYLSIVPSEMIRFLNRKYGMSCTDRGRGDVVVKSELLWNLYATSGSQKGNDLSNPRLKNVTFERLAEDSDNSVPLLAKFLKTRNPI